MSAVTMRRPRHHRGSRERGTVIVPIEEFLTGLEVRWVEPDVHLPASAQMLTLAAGFVLAILAGVAAYLVIAA